MGKRDTRVAFVNPIAARRSSGTVQSGPSLKDYLNRPRPLWDELKEMIKAKRKRSHSLEVFEQNMKKDHRAELDKSRKIFFNTDDVKKKLKRKRSKSKKRKKRPKERLAKHKSQMNHLKLSSSENECEENTTNPKEIKCSSRSSSESEWEEVEVINEREKKKRKKQKKYAK